MHESALRSSSTPGLGPAGAGSGGQWQGGRGGELEAGPALPAWDKAGVALHLVDMGGQTIDTSTAMGRFFLTVMAGATELERNLIRERTKVGMAVKRANEKMVGSIPYGYELAEDGVTLLPAFAQRQGAEGYRPGCGRCEIGA